MSLLYYGVLLSIMAAAAFIDAKLLLIPNKLVLFGLFFSLFWALTAAFSISSVSPVIHWVTGLLTGGAPIFLIIIITRGKMGAGDMKLLAMAGAFLGWRPALDVLFYSIISGGAYSTALLLLGKKTLKDHIPFAPFIALACLIVILL